MSLEQQLQLMIGGLVFEVASLKVQVQDLKKKLEEKNGNPVQNSDLHDGQR